MLRSFDGVEPTVADSAYVDGRAVVVGDVTVGPEASVWPGAVLRGDNGPIVLREGANVQDNATLHETVEIGPYATVGHNAIVHHATVGRRGTVGMGAVVLDDAEVGDRSIVGANATVTEGTTIPDGSLAVGTPAEVIAEVDGDGWATAGDRYVEYARNHAATSEVLERGTIRPEGTVRPEE